MGKYALSSAAEVDAAAAWLHIASNNLIAADRFVDRLTATFERLAEHPRSGEAFTHRGLDFRRVAVSPYIVFYTTSAEDVTIARILHGSRDWAHVL